MVVMRKMMVITAVMMLFLAGGLFLPWTSVAGPPVPPTPPLPLLFIPAPPSVVLIPGTYTYFAPDVEGELLFSGGRWYRPHGGRWYASDHYKGPWNSVPPRNVPPAFAKLPHGYRSLSPGRERIPHDQLRNNWKTWERNKHWDSPGKSGKPSASMKKDAVKKHEKESKHGNAVKSKERGKEDKSLKKEKDVKEDKHGKGQRDKTKTKQKVTHGSDKDKEPGKGDR